MDLKVAGGDGRLDLTTGKYIFRRRGKRRRGTRGYICLSIQSRQWWPTKDLDKARGSMRYW